MKSRHYYLIFIFLLSTHLIQAQEETRSKFNLISYGGIGYGIVENDNEPNYNLNSNSAELLLNYRFNQKFGIATGIGLNDLTGNGFNTAGHFYHERSLLKIPLLATMNYHLTETFRLVAHFGFYAQDIVKDDYRFLSTSQKDVYEGWNFGAQLGLGFVFELFDNFSGGIQYSGQSDFSKFKTKNDQNITDKQKLKHLNSLGVIFLVEL